MMTDYAQTPQTTTTTPHHSDGSMHVHMYERNDL